MPFEDREHSTSTIPDPASPSPLLVEYTEPTRQFSIVTVLIAVNVAVFLLQQYSPYWHKIIYEWGCLQTAAVVYDRQWWRLLTAQYLHASFLHIGLNMVALYFLGRPLAQIWSARKFFVVYTVCGLAGNFFFTLLGTPGFLNHGHPVINPSQTAVGASGCIYGLLGIVAVLFPSAELYVYYLFPVKIRTAAAVMGAISFMSVIERGANYGGEACHLAGLAFGVWWALHGDEWWSHTEWALPWSPPRNKPPSA